MVLAGVKYKCINDILTIAATLSVKSPFLRPRGKENEADSKKYQFTHDVLFSKERSIYGLQSHTLFNCYALNVKKRKVNSIPYGYYDIGQIEDKNIDIEMFVINNSGGSLYDKEEFEKEKIILEKKFSNPTPYEIISNETSNSELNSDEIEKNKLSEKFEENNKLNKTINVLDNKNREKKEKEKNSIMIFTLVLLFFLIIIFIYIINLTYFISSTNDVTNKSSYSSYIIDNSKNYSINKKIKKKYAEDEGALFN